MCKVVNIPPRLKSLLVLKLSSSTGYRRGPLLVAVALARHPMIDNSKLPSFQFNPVQLFFFGSRFVNVARCECSWGKFNPNVSFGPIGLDARGLESQK